MSDSEKPTGEAKPKKTGGLMAGFSSVDLEAMMKDGKISPQMHEGVHWKSRGGKEEPKKAPLKKAIPAQQGEPEAWPHSVRWVAPEDLKPYRQYKRDPSPEFVAEVKAHGFTRPLVLHYDRKSGVASLVDGNHRLAVALAEGMKAVPLWVVHSSPSGPRKTLDGPKRMPPGDMTPSDIGFKELPHGEHVKGAEDATEQEKPASDAKGA